LRLIDRFPAEYATLEWQAAKRSDEGCAEPAAIQPLEASPTPSLVLHRCHPGFIPGQGMLAVLGSFPLVVFELDPKSEHRLTGRTHTPKTLTPPPQSLSSPPSA